MRLTLYQVDAFASRVFAGNPAAVVPLERWLPDATMQAIANENNLSETAFFVPRGDDFDLRWFTPAVEVDLCGHATLASAWVVFERLQPRRTAVRFHTRSGPLAVERAGGLLAMDLPAAQVRPLAPDPRYGEALGRAPLELHRGAFPLAVFARESDVRALAPDFARVAKLDGVLVIATAPGDEVDFVSRVFAPAAGIDEDPVTGAAHCTLVPFWSQRLARKTLRARQISRRGGELLCEDRGERTLLRGACAPYLEGTIEIG
jgi:PhzF family phenazine biosynthesis protein